MPRSLPDPAYPAITVLRRAKQGRAVVADPTRQFDAAAEQFLKWRPDPAAAVIAVPAFQAARMPGWFADQEARPTGTPTRLAMIEAITERFSSLEQTGRGAALCVASSGPDDPPIEFDDRLDWRHFHAAVGARISYLRELGILRVH